MHRKDDKWNGLVYDKTEYMFAFHIVKLKRKQHLAIHTNYITVHCTTLQYNHTTWHGTL